MSKIKKYWVRYNPNADRIEQQVTESRFKPNGKNWVQIDVDKCCNKPSVICNQNNVMFSCITGSFYMEFINPITASVIGIFSNGPYPANFNDVIPRGVYDIKFYNVPVGIPVNINGATVATGTGADITLSNYDTTLINQIGYCGYFNMSGTGAYIFNTCAGPFNPPNPLNIILSVVFNHPELSVNDINVEYVSGQVGSLSGFGSNWVFTVTNLTQPPANGFTNTVFKLTHSELPGYSKNFTIMISNDNYSCE